VSAGQPPRLAVFLEGIGGCGKTTQAAQVAARLGEDLPGRTIACFAEFSSSPLGDFIRGRTGRQGDFRVAMSGGAADLFVIGDGILKFEEIAAARWDVAVVDRSEWSHLVHAAIAVPEDASRETQEFLWHAVAATVRAFPRLPGRRQLFLLELAPEAALARLARRGGGKLGAAHLRELERMAAAYDDIARRETAMRIVDAARPRDQVTAEIVVSVLARLAESGQ
jgi:thymidylate kinase